ncbi:unnamed protein product [Rhodiola kirilowii]
MINFSYNKFIIFNNNWACTASEPKLGLQLQKTISKFPIIICSSFNILTTTTPTVTGASHPFRVVSKDIF